MSLYHAPGRRRVARRTSALAEGLEPRTLLSLDLVADLNQDSLASNPIGFTESGGLLYFAADDGPHGIELWKTDGTAQGTSLVKDIDPRPKFRYAVGQLAFEEGNARPSGLTDVNGTLYFYADDGAHGAELWKSDGTAAGTVMVKDINPGPAPSNFVYSPGPPGPDHPIVWRQTLAALGGVLYFVAYDASGGRALWRSDGSEAGTVPVRPLPDVPRDARVDLFALGDRLYFQGYDPATGAEPWASDGTADGTALLKDTRPGPESSSPAQFISAGGRVYFAGETGKNARGYALYGVWQTDGTSGGTRLVHDGSRVVTFGTAGQRLYVGTSDDALHGALWKIDPGDATPQQVREFPDPGLYQSLNYPGGFTALNETDVLFSVYDRSVGYELWRSDGTEAGTGLLADLLPGPPSSGPRYMKNVGGVVYFAADSALGGTPPYPLDAELYKTDGTSAGTVRVTHSNAGALGLCGYTSGFVGYRGRVLFAGTEPHADTELWQSDGTEAGTTPLKDINTDTRGGAWGLVRSGGSIFFDGPGADPWHSGLWATDGTGEGTRRVKDVPSDYPTDVGGRLFFLAHDDRTLRSDLWTSDGTPQGTVQVRANVASPEVPGGSSGLDFFDLGGALLFTGGDAEHGYELWRSDGTDAGTTLVRDIRPGTYGSLIEFLEVANGGLLFWADDGVHGRELWKTDGTTAGTVLVKDLVPGPGFGADWLGVTPVVLDGEVYFPAHDDRTGSELWKSDGTEAGTKLVADVLPGAGQTHPTELTVFSGAVYYIGWDGAGGQALYRTDGTAAGTMKVAVDYGSPYVTLSGLEAAGGLLYFGASAGAASGVYRSDGTAGGTMRLADNVLGGEWTALGGKVYFAGRRPWASFGRPPDQAGPELWETDGTPAGTRVVADLYPGPEGSHPMSLMVVGPSLLFTADDARHGRELWRFTPDDAPPAAVVGRHVFYNDSAFDGRDPASSAADDRAIAADKQALPPGRRGSFANVTGYAKGINGVMIDVARLPVGAERTLTADDFESPVAPRSVTVRRGAGVNGSDRITLTWANYSVVNRWLRLTVKANGRTGLAQPDVFSFGNLVGETGDSGPELRVTALDVANLKRGLTAGATTVLSPLDLNGDGRVNALDLALVKKHLGYTLAAAE